MVLEDARVEILEPVLSEDFTDLAALRDEVWRRIAEAMGEDTAPGPAAGRADLASTVEPRVGSRP